ncbi:hypothetical protein [Actinoplanes couchii]|uniref:Uncharacterized protein n=1 Tax=Actinoplanes couchii TaxID=403638 RepID=A0ABQ3XR17_9ACTN|nr:hypothetical protein [Actinoplanes couchii]MDR6318168.1 hypothetical protein [Actinoplanes couchii]GID60962.1 hypothetical protein Aco03nite_093660 [Actinoplanes couchii]
MRSVVRSVGLLVLWVVVYGTAALLLQLGGWGMSTLRYTCPDLFLALFGVPLTGFLLFRLLRRLARRWAFRRFADGSGWQRVDPGCRDWPWAGPGLHRDDPARFRVRGRVLVRSAWTFRSGDRQVTVGEVTGFGGILRGTLEHDFGQIVFVLVTLPAPLGSMAMRKPFEFIGDRHGYTSTLNVAFLNGEIPPWTVRGDELFTFQRLRSGTDPSGIPAAVQRALRVAELLPEPTR